MSSLTSAKWWARAACQARESMECARVARDEDLKGSACNAYVCSKRHMWGAMDGLTAKQMVVFHKYLTQQMAIFGIAAI